jgi:hypothetical protein
MSSRDTSPRELRAQSGAIMRKLLRLLVLCVIAAGCTSGSAVAPPKRGAIEPLRPQPEAGALAPGLATRYWFVKFANLSELLTYTALSAKPGEPIADLNHEMGTGAVLTSGTNENVGAEITGLIRLSEAGAYTFTLTSNDAASVEVGGALVVEDPAFHADNVLSSPPIDIREPGWYALRVFYFQRGGKATLQVSWTRPGRSAPEIIPASAFARLQR